MNKMLIKYFLSGLMVMIMFNLARAQSMRWIPAPSDTRYGTCPNEPVGKVKTLSYVLEYTPGVSGVLTSYTTGFLVSCTSSGSAILKNQSTSMTNKSRVISGCNSQGVVLMNSSGNTGDPNHNTIVAGVPVILHQVCLTIPYGEAITIKEDEVTDLTTSIDIGNGIYTTEFPTYETATVERIRYDEGKPIPLIDFKGIPAGDFIAQLDWSTSVEKGNSHFIIERSNDGLGFIPIGRVESVENSMPVKSYQFFDKEAHVGNNEYRLQLVNVNGKVEYSPVRIVTFSEKLFAVTFSPNPANDELMVEIQNPTSTSHIKLMDAMGRVVLDDKNENKLLKIHLDVKKLNPGIYTLVVETDKDKFSDKVVIAH